MGGQDDTGAVGASDQQVRTWYPDLAIRFLQPVVGASATVFAVTEPPPESGLASSRRQRDGRPPRRQVRVDERKDERHGSVVQVHRIGEVRDRAGRGAGHRVCGPAQPEAGPRANVQALRANVQAELERVHGRPVRGGPGPQEARPRPPSRIPPRPRASAAARGPSRRRVAPRRSAAALSRVSGPGARPGPFSVRWDGWPGPGSRRHSGAPWRAWAETDGTRMVSVAPPARPTRSAEVRELGTAGRTLATRCKDRAEDDRRGRGRRLEGVSSHAGPDWRKPPKNRETRPRAHSREARSAGTCGALWATPPRSVDAPFVELHDRHSTAVLAMSNGAPPAASGTM